MIKWSNRSKADLIDIKDYIAQDSAHAARIHLQRIKRKVLLISKTPLSYRTVPEFGRPDIREAILGNYRIVFWTDGSNIVIATIFEGHRLINMDVDKLLSSKK